MRPDPDPDPALQPPASSSPSPSPPDRVFTLREEDAADVGDIDAITRAAFQRHPFSQQTEHLIVRGLRAAAALRLSLVAVQDGTVIGHVAFSPVRIDGADTGWCGLGPLSVAPGHQRQGVGSALVRSGLRRLRAQGAAGCVVLGEPAYYTRLGFGPCPGLLPAGVPAALFMALTLRDAVPPGTVPQGAVPQAAVPQGAVRYHPAFDVLPPGSPA